MDLSLTDEQQALLASARSWLDTNYCAPGAFGSLEEEIAWGRQWQARMAADGWVGLDWPVGVGGRGLGPVEVALFNMAYARTGAPQPVNRVGLSHAGPTLLAHGTADQQRQWLPRILTAEEIWCQLFSEPEAGSDLTALATRATQVDDGWLVNGQKVWTSYAEQARWGMCLARTGDVPGHRGISFLVLDMTAPGVTIRPLLQITGQAEFSEVFLDDVHVPASALVGEVNGGWKVAGTTLAYERGVNFPIKEQVVHEVHLARLLEQAEAAGLFDDLLVAEDLAEAYVRLRLLAWANLRTITRLERGEQPGAESSWIKLQWSQLTQQLAHVAVDAFGEDPDWRGQYLWSRAASVAGGTSEIQRTIIGERILGLPRGT